MAEATAYADLRAFVEALLDDWATDENRIFYEWNVSAPESVLTANIEERRGEWKAIWAAFEKGGLDGTVPPG